MTKEEIKQLSEEIKLQRFKKKKSQDECAKSLNISIPTYRDIEYNPNKLTFEQALILSDFLEWNLFEFFLQFVLHNAIKEKEEENVR